jgi:HK97 family phage portal protein
MLFEHRYHPSQDPDSSFSRVLAGGDESASGVMVTPESALRITAWLACVRIIAETAGSLPLITYKRLPRGKERATNHYLYSLLHDVPNPEMTAMTYRETITSHVASRGNGISEIEFDKAGRVRALWPLNPDNVRMERRDGQLWYVYTLPGSVGGRPVGIPSDRILHVRWLTRNGLWAYSPTDLARESIGLAQATQEHGARLFSNGAEPGIVLTHPKELSEKAYERITGAWEARHQGLEKKHRMAILEDGLGIEKIGLTNEDSQFLQTREFQIADIARMFGISLDMLAVNGASATYASVEAFGLRFVTYTMRPWFVRWEQEISRSLLTESERKDYFSEHLVDALLRGDLAQRYSAFVQAVQNGFMTINEIREAENRNPVEGGDLPMVPLNLGPLGMSQPQQEPAARTEDVLRSQRHVFFDALGRILRREANDLARLARRDDRDGEIERFYGEHVEFIKRQIEPVVRGQLETLKRLLSIDIDDAGDAGMSGEIASELAARIAKNHQQSVLALDANQFEAQLSAWQVRRQAGGMSEFDALNRTILKRITLQEEQ